MTTCNTSGIDVFFPPPAQFLAHAWDVRWLAGHSHRVEKNARGRPAPVRNIGTDRCPVKCGFTKHQVETIYKQIKLKTTRAMEFVATFNLSREQFTHLLQSADIAVDEVLEQLFVNKIEEDGLQDLLSLRPVSETGGDRFVSVGKLAMSRESFLMMQKNNLIHPLSRRPLDYFSWNNYADEPDGLDFRFFPISTWCGLHENVEYNFFEYKELLKRSTRAVDENNYKVLVSLINGYKNLTDAVEQAKRNDIEPPQIRKLTIQLLLEIKNLGVDEKGKWCSLL